MKTRTMSLLVAFITMAALWQACSSDTASPVGEGGGDAGAAADTGGGNTDAGGPADTGGGGDTGAAADAGFAEVPGTKAFFTIPYPVDERKFFNFPFPSDLRVKPDGRIDLTGFPSGQGTIATYIDLIGGAAGGWATQGAAYFKLDAAIGETSLPAVADSSSAASPVFLVNVDAGSPEKGAFTPLRFKFYKDKVDPATITYLAQNLLAVLPESGFPLPASTTHALVITRKIKGVDGAPLGSPSSFEATKAKAALDDADLEKARALYAPVFDYLETLGVERADVAAMTVFTTQDPYSELKRMRDWLQDDGNLPQPQPKGLTYVKKENGLHRYEGTFTTKLFQKGAPPYSAADSGYFVFDQNGDPVPQREEEVRFALGVPDGTMPAEGWPIVQQVHGTGGDYLSHFGATDPAPELAAEGIASLGFDLPLHGARNTGGWDESLATFNVQNVLALRDNFRQCALDSVVVHRLMETLTVPAGVSHTGAAITFDAAKRYFFGHSQGGLTGPLFAAVEPTLPLAFFSEGGGRFVISVLEKTEPVDIPKAIKALLGTDDPLDLYHPALNLLQIGAEPTDPANYAVHLIRRPPGAGPINVIFTEGTADPYTPPNAINALATSAYVQLSKQPYYHDVPELDLRWVGLGASPLADTPFSNNCTAEDGKKATGALVMFKDEGHFAVFDNATAKAMYRRFFKTMVDTGTAEVGP